MARRPLRDDGETPPWMERDPVPPRRSARAPDREPEPTHTLVSWRTLIVGAVLAVVAAAGLIWGVRTLIQREPGSVTAEGANAPGEVPLIRAPATPYKVKPVDAGGAQLAGAGDPATSAGGDAIGSIIDTGAAPETPQRPAAPAPVPTDLLPGGQDAEAGDAEAAAPVHAAPADPAPAPPAAAVAAPRKAKPPAALAGADTPGHKPAAVKARAKPAPVEASSAGRFQLPDDLAAAVKPKTSASGGSLQLGAFSTREKAQAAWARYAAEFPEVAALYERIAPLERDGQTLYRLRASGAGARGDAICARIKAAGDACLVSP